MLVAGRLLTTPLDEISHANCCLKSNNPGSFPLIPQPLYTMTPTLPIASDFSSTRRIHLAVLQLYFQFFFEYIIILLL